MTGADWYRGLPDCTACRRLGALCYPHWVADGQPASERKRRAALAGQVPAWTATDERNLQRRVARLAGYTGVVGL